MRALALSLLLTALTLGWLSYGAFSTSAGVARASARHARAAELHSTIIHLDEVLTMSARMAAATGDTKWEERYREHEGQLDDAIGAAMRADPPSIEVTRQLDSSNRKLVAMEKRAFNEVRAGHAERGHLILDSPAYARQKAIYAAAITQYMNRASEEQRQVLQKRQAASLWVFVAALVGVMGLSLTWVVAMRELARWRDEQSREIEARRAANAELEAFKTRFLRMAANVPGMVYRFILKPDGTIKMPFVSEGAREVYGFDPEAIRANPMLALDAVTEEDRASMDESIAQSARDLTPWHWDGRMTMADGTCKWISGTSRPERRPNGDVVWDGVLLDITARKNHEAALEQARHEADAANRAKSEFLSRMSHELRTPLNAILGFGQLLEFEQLTATQTESVDQILVAGRHLLALINEVLDIARIESGQQEMQLQEVDAAQLVREVCALVKPLAQANQTTLDMGFGAGCCGPIVCGGKSERVIADPQRFKQILLNLLSNAVKYAGTGARVEIGCAQIIEDQGARKMALTIRDNGPGIAPELQQRVWMPFDRIGAETGATEGAGIGLPLARALAQAMDGALELHSAPGQGCTFTLTLPCSAPNAAPRQNAPEPAVEFANFLGFDTLEPANIERLMGETEAPFHLIYIEDNVANVRLVQRVVSGYEGIQLQSYATAASGLARIEAQRPDLLLLDVQLPDMSGDQILERLRASEVTADLPVVVLSSDATQHQIEHFINAGADGYLTKPLDIGELKTMLENHIEAARGAVVAA